MDALANPTRRAIYDKLRDRPLSVGELASHLPVRRPAVSQHLKVLEEARLVRFRREGTRHVYRPDPAGLEALRAYVESLWDDVLEAFARAEDGADQGGTT
jgi:DNA-binding transcriptional ArsR family regulator